MEFEQVIRERAYLTWLASDREHGNAGAHWLAAEAEILIASMDAAARVMADPEEARDERALTKPRQKRRAASKTASTGDGRVRSLSASPKDVRRRSQVKALSVARSAPFTRKAHKSITVARQ